MGGRTEDPHGKTGGVVLTEAMANKPIIPFHQWTNKDGEGLLLRFVDLTGEYSTVECGEKGVAISTADEVTWIARTGALFIHRWQREGGGERWTNFRRIKAVDGERITFRCGKIIKREKPNG